MVMTVDSMVHHDDINTLRSPYTIRVVGAGRAGLEAQQWIRRLAHFIDEAGAPDRGGELEVAIRVEE
jgi:hypothetical protein